MKDNKDNIRQAYESCITRHTSEGGVKYIDLDIGQLAAAFQDLTTSVDSVSTLMEFVCKFIEEPDSKAEGRHRVVTSPMNLLSPAAVCSLFFIKSGELASFPVVQDSVLFHFIQRFGEAAVSVALDMARTGIQSDPTASLWLGNACKVDTALYNQEPSETQPDWFEKHYDALRTKAQADYERLSVSIRELADKLESDTMNETDRDNCLTAERAFRMMAGRLVTNGLGDASLGSFTALATLAYIRGAASKPESEAFMQYHMDMSHPVGILASVCEFVNLCVEPICRRAEEIIQENGRVVLEGDSAGLFEAVMQAHATPTSAQQKSMRETTVVFATAEDTLKAMLQACREAETERVNIPVSLVAFIGRMGNHMERGVPSWCVQSPPLRDLLHQSLYGPAYVGTREYRLLA